MGYTHYWDRPRELDAERFAHFREHVARLLAHLPPCSTSAGGYYADAVLAVRGPDGTGGPIVIDELVSFNGDATPIAGEGGDDLSHETFHIPRVLEPEAWQRPDEQGRYFDFCKTARKPYDLVVIAALLALRHHFPAVAVSSDGTPEDWAEGVVLCRRVLGYGELPPTIAAKAEEVNGDA